MRRMGFGRVPENGEITVQNRVSEGYGLNSSGVKKAIG
jgi:hypothetical protein